MTRDDAVKSLSELGGAEEKPGDGAGAKDGKDAADAATEGAEAPAKDAEAKDGAAEAKGEAEEKAEESKGDAEDAESEDEKADEDAEPKRVPYERLAAEVGKRHEAEERAQAAESRIAQLDNEAARALGLHPSYLSTEEAKLIVQANAVEALEAFLFTNLDGFDGVAGAKAHGLPERMSAQEVREELVRVRREVSRLVPKANGLYEDRLSQQLADMKAGREARLAQADKSAGAGKKTVPGPVTTKTAATAERGAKAPRSSLPSGAGASSKPVTQPPASRGMSEERFNKAGGGREAAVAELAQL